MASNPSSQPADMVKAAFRSCDVNGNGIVSRTDLEKALSLLGGWSDTVLQVLFESLDPQGKGLIEYSAFIDWIFKADGTPGLSMESGTCTNVNIFLPQGHYLSSRGLDHVISTMATSLDAAQPEDPYLWMIRYLTDARRKQSADPSMPISLATCKSSGSRSRSVNTSACLRKGVKPILDIVLSGPTWRQVEDPADENSDVYFVWNGAALLSRLGHPSAKERVPQLPPGAWINRFPGMGCLCDKVNMALALRLLQRLWPEKFRFWPKSWLLPAEIDSLQRHLAKHKGHDTVIVKPENGSQGEGIFLVQTSADLDVKLSAKPHWGGGFGALAQRYLPKPLTLDGLKFDLRLYVVVTCTDPLRAYLCTEGLARFCTTKYEAPTQANASQHYMHLSNYSVNKKAVGFVKADDPWDVNTKASKRPLSTLIAQIEAHEAAAGRTFNERALFAAFEEVAVVLLQAFAPVLNVTYDRVTKESKRKAKMKPKAKAKPKTRSRHARSLEDSADEEEVEDEEEDDDEDDDFAPNCFQVLGIDVLLDEKLQPWLLEVNNRPSMDIDNPVRMAEAPPGMRRCVCRDMDGEEHVHLQSEVDVRVKQLVIDGAFELALNGGGAPGYMEMKFDHHSPSEAQETLQAVARIYQAAGGQKKAFTTLGLRRALAGAVKAGMSPHDLDTVVTRWKFQGYRQDGNVEEDGADIGVLDFAQLLQELAIMRDPDSEPLDALTSLIELCDPDN